MSDRPDRRSNPRNGRKNGACHGFGIGRNVLRTCVYKLFTATTLLKLQEQGILSLDDHLHDVPPMVFDLLALLAQHTCGPLDVIIERDGAYPDFA